MDAIHGSFVVKSEKEEIDTFTIAPNTIVLSGKEEIVLVDLLPNDQVAVTWKNVAGKKIAVKIVEVAKMASDNPPQLILICCPLP